MTSEKADIDREKVYAHQLILTVTDRHGNVNSMPVSLKNHRPTLSTFL